MIQCFKQNNISQITSGIVPEGKADPFEFTQIQKLIKELKTGFKKVIIYGPAFS